MGILATKAISKHPIIAENAVQIYMAEYEIPKAEKILELTKRI